MPEKFNPALLEAVDRPLQQGGLTPELLREAFIPARGHSLDTRWVMDVKALEELLRIARASPSQRVVVHHATVRVRKWREGDHVYETYAMLGGAAQPERLGLPAQGITPGRGGSATG